MKNGRQKAYDTRDSQDVSVPSTSRARCCLTSQIGRDGVLSAGYGRKRVGVKVKGIIDKHNPLSKDS